MASVIYMYITPVAGGLMRSKYSVEAKAGVGLVGDRYSTGSGTWDKSSKKKIRHVTLIEFEAIHDANAWLHEQKLPKFSVSETRRNLVTFGVGLNDLVGKEFYVGAVKMRGLELAEPCEWPSKCAGKKKFKEAFENRGGLRAEVLEGGIIKLDDRIIV